MKNQKRDLVLASLLWTSFVSFAVALACLSVLSPAAYILLMGSLACLAVIGGSFAAAIAISSDGGILSAYVSMELIKGGFELAGAMAGLASACSASSN